MVSDKEISTHQGSTKRKADIVRRAGGYVTPVSRKSGPGRTSTYSIGDPNASGCPMHLFFNWRIISAEEEDATNVEVPDIPPSSEASTTLSSGIGATDERSGEVVSGVLICSPARRNIGGGGTSVGRLGLCGNTVDSWRWCWWGVEIREPTRSQPSVGDSRPVLPLQEVRRLELVRVRRVQIAASTGSQPAPKSPASPRLDTFLPYNSVQGSPENLENLIRLDAAVVDTL
ncbi:hypothetical protein BZA05DRAFT_277657 [Tricharina praecox]|uniref:uncharacterized protein n=1 Tax=Tricharina praecox TaxID=43433 RepID=UPI002220AD3E|nr:uncharacterized protein BZA05DRAFT_277657 [Tricharina praecox]KAI5854023.1 hypothetical protein BZA05DRAFT_277657 [Tricharina praecox]